MVYHFVSAAQTGVFIFNGVETMRAAGYYPFNIVAVQHLNIHHGLHLEQKLVTCPLGRVADTAFLGTQNREADTHMLQYFANVAGYLLRPLIKASRAAHPKKYLRLLAFSYHF